jgi:hypothetical protein
VDRRAVLKARYQAGFLVAIAVALLEEFGSYRSFLQIDDFVWLV